RVGEARERVGPSAELPLAVLGADPAAPGQDDGAQLALARLALRGPAVAERQHLEADVAPAGGLRRDLEQRAVGRGLRDGMHVQVGQLASTYWRWLRRARS